MVGIADQHAILEHADIVITQVELDLTVTEQWVIGGRAELPGALRFQVRIARIDTVCRQFGRGDEIEEVELGNSPLDRKLRVPLAARFPVDRQARLPELELAVSFRVTIDREM